MKLLLVISIVVLFAAYHAMGAANPWTPIEDQEVVQKYRETALKHFKKTKNQDAVFDRIVGADQIKEKSTNSSKAVRLVLVFRIPKTDNKKETVEMQCRYHFQEDGKVGHYDCPY
ncbi:uncharacterized protein LOC141849139 [Brevipalpus obovatus]|uniref:uncharacterized protein LOC141849139 n=1 Tax=Brevipalpus obovatus TaxID=246614 RepID=UPI003D9EB0E7